MSEDENVVKYDHQVDLKDHIALLKKIVKGTKFKIMRVQANYLYDKCVHFEVVLRANRDGITKPFSTYLSIDMYEKTIKPMFDKIESWTLPNKRNPESEPLQFPIRLEERLETAEEDLSKFFDDFIDE